MYQHRYQQPHSNPRYLSNIPAWFLGYIMCFTCYRRRAWQRPKATATRDIKIDDGYRLGLLSAEFRLASRLGYRTTTEIKKKKKKKLLYCSVAMDLQTIPSGEKKSDFKLHVYLEVEHLLYVSYLKRPPIEQHTYYFFSLITSPSRTILPPTAPPCITRTL